jgi:site-specific DNA recombinase
MKTAAIYARFSSDLQKDRSISDQVADCEALAKREGYKVVAKFSDRAKSGSTLFGRDGAIELMVAAKARKFDVVIAESQSRLSRDPEDIAGILKRLKFAGIELHTIADGVIDNMKSGLRSIVDSEYIKNLATGIKRGQNGLVREGLFPGAVTYGYERVPGKPAERVIHQEHAKIIRRIFKEYAEGSSPRHIAAELTRDGIPAPSGRREWNHQTLMSGGGKAKGGILGNTLYVGTLVWGQHIRRKNPDTNVEIRIPRPKEEHMVVDVPRLRVIDQKLWDAVQAVRNERAVAKFGSTGTIIRRPVVARGQHLLSGLLRCGVCNGHMIVNKVSRGTRYVSCSAAHQTTACSHRKGYMMDVLQERALAGLREMLADPEGFADLARTHAVEYAAQQKRASADRVAATKELNMVKVKIDRITRTIIDVGHSPAMSAALKEEETKKVGLEERVKLLSASNVVTMHPTLIEQYLDKIKNLDKVLTEDSNAPKNRIAFRNAIDRIVVHPTEQRADYDVSVYGRLSAMMGVDFFPPTRSNKEILTSEGFACGDNVNAD